VAFDLRNAVVVRSPLHPAEEQLMAATTLSPQTNKSLSSPPGAEHAPPVSTPAPAITPGEKAIYWPDFCCLLFWLGGLGILFALQLFDVLYRLLRLL